MFQRIIIIYISVHLNITPYKRIATEIKIVKNIEYIPNRWGNLTADLNFRLTR